MLIVMFSNSGSSVSDSDSDFSSNSSNSEKISSSRKVLSMEWRILLPSSRRMSKSSSKISLITSILKHVSSFKITKSAGKVNLPTSMSIFLAILTGYWNDLSSNLKLILVGLRVLRDSFAYKEYGIRLMLAPRSAKALQEKVLLKLHRIRKLHGSLSFGGTLFWITAELSSLRKAAEICSILCLLLMSSLRNLP
ncbi:hypothetical protein Tco_0914950 [Tanacetum coccineum]